MKIKHLLAVTAACALYAVSGASVSAQAEETSVESSVNVGVSSTDTGDTDILSAVAALAVAGAAACVSKKKN